MTDRGLIDDAEAWDRTFSTLMELRKQHHDALMNIERWLLGAGVIRNHERYALNQPERAAYWAYRTRKRKVDNG